MVAWSSPRVSLGGGRATGSLEGKEVWAGERSDLRDEIKRGKEEMLSCPAKGYKDSRAKGRAKGFLVSLGSWYKKESRARLL